MGDVEITGNPKLEDSAIDLEYAAARKEGRQPVCPFCGTKLEVEIREDSRTCWVWDEDLGEYEIQRESDADPPYCKWCEHGDWDFLDYDFIQR